MYPASQAFLDSIQSTDREFSIRIHIDTAFDSLDLTDADIAQGTLKLTEASVSGDTLELGGAVISNLDVTLLNTNGRFNDIQFNGGRIIPKVGLRLTDGTIEYIPLGLFHIDSVSRPTSVITLGAADNLVLFDKDFSNVNVSFPITNKQILIAICNYCGVALKTENFMNSDYQVQTRPDGSMSCRDVVSSIAEMAASFIRCDRTSGALELVMLKNPGCVTEVNVDGGYSGDRQALNNSSSAFQTGTSDTNPAPISFVDGSSVPLAFNGRTFTNELSNSGFESGATGWTNSGLTVDTSIKYNGSQSLKFVTGGTDTKVVLQKVSGNSADKFYCSAMIYLQSNAGGAVNAAYLTIANTTQSVELSRSYCTPTIIGSWQKLSKIVTVATGDTGICFRFYSYNNVCTGNLDACMAINLTQLFGAGNEPTQAWCDANINYIDDTQSVTNPKFLSTGKNLFNSATITNGYAMGTSGSPFVSSGWWASDLVPVVQGKTYIFTGLGPTTYSYVCFYSASKTFLSSLTNTAVISAGKMITVPAGAYYVRFAAASSAGAFQLELGSAATTYEAYKSSTLAITGTVPASSRFTWDGITGKIDGSAVATAGNLQAYQNGWIFVQNSDGTPVTIVPATELSYLIDGTQIAPDEISGGDFSWYNNKALNGGVFRETIPEISLGASNRYNFSIDDDPVTITGIELTAEDKNYLVGSDYYSITISDNAFIQDDPTSVLNAIADHLIGYCYLPYTSDWQGNPALQPGDVVRQTDRNGAEYLTIITNSTYSYRGTCQLSAKGASQISSGYQSTATKKISQLKRAINNKQSQIDALTNAINSATTMLCGFWGGHVVIGDSTKNPNYDGCIFICDYIGDDPIHPDLTKATKVWRWNLGGFGYSENGIEGPYKSAINEDGTIVTQIITANMINAGILQSLNGKSWINLDDGSLSLGDGAIQYDPSNGFNCVEAKKLSGPDNSDGTGIYAEMGTDSESSNADSFRLYNKKDQQGNDFNFFKILRDDLQGKTELSAQGIFSIASDGGINVGTSTNYISINATSISIVKNGTVAAKW